MNCHACSPFLVLFTSSRYQRPEISGAFASRMWVRTRRELAMDRERLTARAVLAVEHAVLHRRLEDRGVTVEVENQRPIFEFAARRVFVVIPVEKPAFDAGPIAGELDLEGNLGPVDVNRRGPEARKGLRPQRAGASAMIVASTTISSWVYSSAVLFRLFCFGCSVRIGFPCG